MSGITGFPVCDLCGIMADFLVSTEEVWEEVGSESIRVQVPLIVPACRKHVRDADLVIRQRILEKREKESGILPEWRRDEILAGDNCQINIRQLFVGSR